MKILSILLATALLAVSALAADGPIRHVVHFKFKADADKAQVAKVVTEFAALKGKIPVVEALEYGTNVSPEKHDKGFTHCWIATFKNAADRDAYLVHPDHQAFVALLKPVLEDALVIDFVVTK
ncbi:MAG: Dabb family protein [Chthoniobacter sp.]|nr:Dabb family protein [Chthoniobacter sp.]